KGLLSTGSGLTLTPDNVAVEYPETVLPGQTFTVKVQPGGMSTGGKDTGRMKYDIALPQGVKISNLRLDGGASGLNANPAAVVQRVDASGKPNANGAFARIWDGANSVNNGGNENDQWYNLGFVSVPRAGLAVDRNKPFRLPRIAFDGTAPDPRGSKIEPRQQGEPGQHPLHARPCQRNRRGLLHRGCRRQDAHQHHGGPARYPDRVRRDLHRP